MDNQQIAARLRSLADEIDRGVPTAVQPPPGPVEKPVAVSPWPEFPEPVEYPAGKVLIKCKPPNGDYLDPELGTILKQAATETGLDITVVHGSADAPGLLDINHAWRDFDIEYQKTATNDARLFLVLIDRLPVQKSTLHDPTPRQKLSAALAGVSFGNHETHAHVPGAGGQIVVSPERRREILDAAGRM